MTVFSIRQKCLYILLSAFLYGPMTLVLKSIFNLPNTDIRISAFLPPLLGLLWGLPGAIGIAIGNLISDLYSDFAQTATAEEFLFGFIANFLIAYLPYKIWYTIKVDKDTSRFNLHVHNLIKFFLTLMASTWITALFLALNTSANEDPKQFFLLILSNNLDISLLICTPLLIFLTERGCHFRQPSAKTAPDPGFCRAFDSLLLIFVLASTLLIFLPDNTLIRERSVQLVLCALPILYIFKPFSPLPVPDDETFAIRQPIYLKITRAVCLFTIGIIVISAATIFSQGTERDFSSAIAWKSLYTNLFYLIHFIFAVFLYFLWYTEKHFIHPLTQVTQKAVQFSQYNHQQLLPREALLAIHSGDELEALSDAFNQMLQDLHRYVITLKETLSEKERMQAELSLAMRLQASLLPPAAPVNDRWPGQLDLAALMYPAYEVGGDLYDFFALDDDHLVLIVADVSGKGIPAALFMTVTRAMLHTRAQSGLTPGQIFHEANNDLCSNNPEDMFATAFLGIYEISTRHFSYANAGHTKPVLLHASGKADILSNRPNNLMLAGMEDVPYTTHETDLAEGDLLILYTDGVTEAENSAKEFYQQDRLVQSAEKLLTLEEKKNAAALLRKDIAGFTAGAAQSDDITLVTLFVH